MLPRCQPLKIFAGILIVMKGQFFEYLYQYNMFKSWHEETINELVKEIPEDQFLALPNRPKDTTLIIDLIDKWNCNFIEFIDIFEKTGFLKDIQLCWKTPENNLDILNREYFLCIKISIIEQIESKNEKLVARGEKYLVNYTEAINNFKVSFEEVCNYLTEFYEGGFLFKRYDFYMDLATMEVLNKMKALASHLEESKNKSMTEIEKKLDDDNIIPQIRNILFNMLQFIKKEYEDIQHKQAENIGNNSNKLNIPDDYDGFPALVLRMRADKKSREEIAKKIDELHPYIKDNKNKEHQNITNPMLGILLSERKYHSSWKEIGERARGKTKKNE